MSYEAILDRLSEYRAQNGLRQTQIAHELHMTQGQYSKVEAGKVKISYDNLCTLRENGCDIDLLIMGEPRQELLPCLQKLAQKENESFIACMKLCTWVCEQWNRGQESSVTMGERLLMQWTCMDGYRRTQWERLRRTCNNISQINMADKIGVNIKKYRLLEREEVKPDAELLLNVYETTQCKPEFFMDERAYYLSVMNAACKGNAKREEQLRTVLMMADYFEK